MSKVKYKKCGACNGTGLFGGIQDCSKCDGCGKIKNSKKR
jgi:DnaJ-class molecular chaperone